MRIGILTFLVATCICLFGCRDKDYISDDDILAQYVNLPKVPYAYANISIPEQLDKSLIQQQDNTPVGNEITNWGATLGRVLFYDKLLSRNMSISCASCHIQSIGFSDSAKFSTGFIGGKTGRHSMGIANTRFRVSSIFFWDGRAQTLEEQVLQPIQDTVEMGLSLAALLKRLQKQPYYKVLFKKAYGDTLISVDRTAKSLAQFVRSIQSFNSKYDAGRTNHSKTEDFTNFTAQENIGKAIFFDLKKGNCGGCHYTDGFVMDVPRNNGLDIWETTNDKDVGYENTTSDENDRGKFIAPSLRNIALRPPYMHDGRFATLEQVVDHYSDNIQWSNTLDDHLKATNPNTAVRFNLSNEEKKALVSFLKTLNDNKTTTDHRFTDPF